MTEARLANRWMLTRAEGNRMRALGWALPNASPVRVCILCNVWTSWLNPLGLNQHPWVCEQMNSWSLSRKLEIRSEGL